MFFTSIHSSIKLFKKSWSQSVQRHVYMKESAWTSVPLTSGDFSCFSLSPSGSHLPPRFAPMKRSMPHSSSKSLVILTPGPFGCSTTSALWQVQESFSSFIDYLAFLIIRVRDDLLQLSTSWTAELKNLHSTAHVYPHLRCKQRLWKQQ